MQKNTTRGVRSLQVMVLLGIVACGWPVTESRAESYQLSFTPLLYPSSTESDVNAVDGQRAVGSHYPSYQGYYYDGSTYTNLQHPLTTYETTPFDLQGDTIVGRYYDGTARGFTYSISGESWGAFDVADASGTVLDAIDGTRYAGTYTVGYDPGTLFYGFIHNTVSGSTTQLAATALGATQTFLGDVHGDWVGGSFQGGSGRSAFLYEISTATYSEFVLPFAGVTWAAISGISDDYIVGSYTADGLDHGFLYDQNRDDWLTIDIPGAVNGTGLGKVSGSRIAAYGYDADWVSLGSIVEVTVVPEIDPTRIGSVVALVLGAFGLLERRRVKRVETFHPA